MMTLPLSPVEYVFTGVGSQPITFAFLYLNRLDPDMLRNSLNKVLDDFPLLRSQLKRISEKDYEFHVAEDGLTFDVRESNSAFEKPGRIEEYITPVSSVEGKPLTKIALTQTPNGSVLAVSLSHALADGFSYFHFLSSWARVCRGDRIMEPSFQRDMWSSDLLRGAAPVTPDAIYTECGLFYGGKRSQAPDEPVHEERILISEETISSYLEEARKEHNVPFSENDVITAWLWKKYIPMWKKDNDNPETFVTCPFDFRKALDGFPKNYFGCALCFATASVDFNGLLGASLGDLAVLVRSSVGKIKNDTIFNSLKTLENLRQQKGLAAIEEIHLRHPHHGIIVTNLTRLPIRDLDFGFGAPVDFLAYTEVLGSAAILPAEKGVEILVVHPYGSE
ncbi:MAG: acyltransferase [Candidatus Aminicenantales bacterium]